MILLHLHCTRIIICISQIGDGLISSDSVTEPYSTGHTQADWCRQNVVVSASQLSVGHVPMCSFVGMFVCLFTYVGIGKHTVCDASTATLNFHHVYTLYIELSQQVLAYITHNTYFVYIHMQHAIVSRLLIQ